MNQKQTAINGTIEYKPYIYNASLRYLFYKRLFDLVISLIVILVLSLVFLVIFVWVKARSRGAVLYSEEKYGLEGKRFRTYEFPGTIKNKTIRKLPLLFSVLTGNMSFVGPQPASTDDITNFNWYALRLSAKPGITGLWQTGRKTGDPGEKVRMDLKYIRERNFWLDLKILLKSICLMLRKRSHWLR